MEKKNEEKPKMIIENNDDNVFDFDEVIDEGFDVPNSTQRIKSKTDKNITKEISTNDSSDTKLKKPTSKSTLSIALCNKKDRYNDDDIRKSANYVVWKTMNMSHLIASCTSPMFALRTRNVPLSQCNQSIFQYPVSNSKSYFSVKRIRELLTELHANIMEWPKTLKAILGRGVKDNKDVKIYEKTIKKMIDGCQKAAGYMKKVVSTANTFLSKWSELSNRVYPSLTHSLYEGDYHEIFAFSLLRYLYRVDGDPNGITIQGTKTFRGKSEAKYINDLVAMTQEVAHQASVGGARFKFGKNEGGKLFDIKSSKDVDDELIKQHKLDDNNEGVKFKNEFGKINKQLYKEYEITGTEPRYSVLLKPTRGTKILLMTETNVFCSKLTTGVMRGLSILANAGIIPGSFITDVKLCSQYTGAIFDISLTKGGMTIKPNDKTPLFASLNDSTWSQYAVLFDNEVLKATNKKPIDKITYSKLFFDMNHRFDYQANSINDVSPGIKEKHNYQISDIITELNKIDYRLKNSLVQSNVLAFAKARKVSGLTTYENRVNEIKYYGLDSDTVESTPFNWSNLNHVELTHNIDLSKIVVNPDITLHQYMKGLPLSASFISRNYDYYVKKAGELLKSNVRLQLSNEFDPIGMKRKLTSRHGIYNGESDASDINSDVLYLLNSDNEEIDN